MNFDSRIDRTKTLSVKWNPQAITNICNNPEAEPFWVADMDFTVPPSVHEEAKRLAEHGIFGYPVATDQKAIFTTFAKKRHAMDLTDGEITITQGVLSSISLLTELLSEEGDGIIVPLPAYPPFMRIIKLFNRTLIPWPMMYNASDHSFSLDWDHLDTIIAKAKLLIFCSPHNPTGVVFSEEEIRRLVTVCKKHDVPIISDEIHADLSYKPFVSVHTVAKSLDARAVTAMAPSKTFNIAGEHYSVTLFTDSALKSSFEKRLLQLWVTRPASYITALARSCYTDGLPWLNELMGYLEGNATFITEYFDQHLSDLIFLKPDASFIGLIDAQAIMKLIEADAAANPELYDPAKSPDGSMLSRFLGQRAKVACNAGSWFGGEEYGSFVRFNFATQRSRIEGALDRIKTAIRFLVETYPQEPEQDA
ncbi:MAG: aminotransferase class I/II-fold pyridoxal phosphate-dependent enzyme [Sphaerochaeta sp.]